MQEMITLTMFMGFSVLYLKESVTSNHLVAAHGGPCARARTGALTSGPASS